MIWVWLPVVITLVNLALAFRCTHLTTQRQKFCEDRLTTMSERLDNQFKFADAMYNTIRCQQAALMSVAQHTGLIVAVGDIPPPPDRMH